MNINYKEAGTGENILLIHGFSDNLYFWGSLMPTLNNYHTIRIDLPGHGKSENITHPITLDDIVRDVYDFLKEKGIEKTILIGFSMGSAISLKLTLDHPELVTKLILFSCQAHVSDMEKQLFRKIEKEFKDSGYITGFSELLPYVLPEEMINECKDKLILVGQEKSKTEDIDSLCYMIDAGLKLDFFKRLNEIDIPTLLFSGKLDELTTVKEARIVKNHIKNAQLIELDNTKHNILIRSNMSVIDKEILEFLSNN